LKRITVLKQVQEYIDIPDGEQITIETFSKYSAGISIVQNISVLSVTQLEEVKKPQPPKTPKTPKRIKNANTRTNKRKAKNQ